MGLLVICYLLLGDVFRVGVVVSGDGCGARPVLSPIRLRRGDADES